MLSSSALCMSVHTIYLVLPKCAASSTVQQHTLMMQGVSAERSTHHDQHTGHTHDLTYSYTAPAHGHSRCPEEPHATHQLGSCIIA